MEGDPAIRWQVMRDLLDDPAAESERQRTLESGWVRCILDLRTAGGLWEPGRWTGTPWILLTLIDLTTPQASEEARQAATIFLEQMLPPHQEAKQIARMDLCHLGFWLRIGAYFTPHNANLQAIADSLYAEQMEDGGWNCNVRKRPTRHSSFHTTFNVLEGLREWPDPRFREAEARALEFMLQHQLYRSDKTGQVISERFLNLTYPSYWHYTTLRALDYISVTPAIRDARLMNAIDQLLGRQNKNGRWIVEKRIPGVVHFDMEEQGRESRWNTLRALRVLRASGQWNRSASR
jgi:hypothetical protein